MPSSQKTSSSPLLLRVENISYGYEGVDSVEKLKVFSNISFSLYQGDRMMIMGPSGVGKSTLLHVLGLLDQQQEGDIVFSPPHQEPLSTKTMSDNKKTDFRGSFLGFVYQHHHLLPDFTALENVIMPGKIKGLPKQYLLERGEFLLQKVGLYERRKHLPRELSGGQQQRVAIARSLMMKPLLLLADEPTGNLDETTGHDVMNLLQYLHKEENFSFIMVTHNENFLPYANRLMIMEKGHMKEKTIEKK